LEVFGVLSLYKTLIGFQVLLALSIDMPLEWSGCAVEVQGVLALGAMQGHL
jgi:hypothetical protein